MRQPCMLGVFSYAVLSFFDLILPHIFFLSARYVGRAFLSPPAWTNTWGFTLGSAPTNVSTATRWGKALAHACTPTRPLFVLCCAQHLTALREGGSILFEENIYCLSGYPDEYLFWVPLCVEVTGQTGSGLCASAPHLMWNLCSIPAWRAVAGMRSRKAWEHFKYHPRHSARSNIPLFSQILRFWSSRHCFWSAVNRFGP